LADFSTAKGAGIGRAKAKAAKRCLSKLPPVLMPVQAKPTCPRCHKIFKTVPKALKHLKIFHKVKKSDSDYCSLARCSRSTSLKRLKHRRTKKGENLDPLGAEGNADIRVAKKRWSIPPRIFVPMEDRQGHPTCPRCHKTFKAVPSAMVHLKNVHGAKKTDPDYCVLARKSSSSSNKLLKHRRTKKAKNLDPLGQEGNADMEATKRIWSFQPHIFVPMEDRPDQPTCPRCHITFQTVSSVMNHLKNVHRAEKSDPDYSSSAIGRPPRQPCPTCHKNLTNLRQHQCPKKAQQLGLAEDSPKANRKRFKDKIRVRRSAAGCSNRSNKSNKRGAEEEDSGSAIKAPRTKRRRGNGEVSSFAVRSKPAVDTRAQFDVCLKFAEETEELKKLYDLLTVENKRRCRR